MTEIETLTQGKNGKVVITESAKKAFLKACKGNKRSELGMENRCQQFADYGTEGFTEDQFKKEERLATGHNNEKKMVWAMKFSQLRLYGCLDDDGTLFVVGACDKKQQNKANRSLLIKAAQAFGEIKKSGEI